MPKVDRLIARRLDPAGVDNLRSTLGEFDRVTAETAQSTAGFSLYGAFVIGGCFHEPSSAASFGQ